MHRPWLIWPFWLRYCSIPDQRIHLIWTICLFSRVTQMELVYNFINIINTHHSCQRYNNTKIHVEIQDTTVQTCLYSLFVTFNYLWIYFILLFWFLSQSLEFFSWEKKNIIRFELLFVFFFFPQWYGSPYTEFRTPNQNGNIP